MGDAHEGAAWLLPLLRALLRDLFRDLFRPCLDDALDASLRGDTSARACGRGQSVYPADFLRRRGPDGIQPARLVAARAFLDGHDGQLNVRLVEELLPTAAPLQTVRL